MPNHSIIYEESTSMFVPVNGEESKTDNAKEENEG